jgi:hypothetical protein
MLKLRFAPQLKPGNRPRKYAEEPSMRFSTHPPSSQRRTTNRKSGRADSKADSKTGKADSKTGKANSKTGKADSKTGKGDSKTGKAVSKSKSETGKADSNSGHARTTSSMTGAAGRGGIPWPRGARR